MGESASRSTLGLHRFFKSVLFHASRHGRAAEVVGWSNALAALGIGVGVVALGAALPFGVVAAVIAFTLLRVALAHRVTLCLAACMGTLSVAASGGALAWLFAHAIESWPSAPWLGLVVGAIAAGVVPAWAYHELAVLRANGIPDSLVQPAPSSH
jgi:hypothetical protein